MYPLLELLLVHMCVCHIQIPITAENIEAVVTSLVDVLNTTERDDQISSNANITSNTLERAAMVVLSGNFSTNINVGYTDYSIP